MRFLRWLWDIVMRIRAFIMWLWHIVYRIIGPPKDAVKRVLLRWWAVVKAAVRWLLDRWENLWRTAKVDRGKEHYVGTNGVFLLATLTLFVVWYVLPLARLLEVPPSMFRVSGFGLLILFAVAWRAPCREDRDSRFAQWTQTVGRSTGVRRFDQLGLALSAVMLVTARLEPQLWPFAVGSAVAFVGLLVQVQVPRSSVAVFSIPSFPGLDAVRKISFTGEGTDVQLSWELDMQGITRRHTASVRVSSQRLGEARAANKGSSSNVQEMVDWVIGMSSPEIDHLALQIQDQIVAAGYSLYGAVACHAAACQAIPYSLDEDSTGHDEYWRYPIETLADQTGDCEDTSILLAALLRRSGFACVLIGLPGHVAVGVHVPEEMPGVVCEVQGRRYYYCETTATGWRVGQMPAQYRGEPVDIIPIPALGAR